VLARSVALARDALQTAGGADGFVTRRAGHCVHSGGDERAGAPAHKLHRARARADAGRKEFHSWFRTVLARSVALERDALQTAGGAVDL